MLKEEEKEEELCPPKVLSDVFEALAGAIFIDSEGSIDTVRRCFWPMMSPTIGIVSR